MKKICLTSAVLLTLLSGCIFSEEKYIAPATYDLGKDHASCRVPVRRIRVKNVSGADRRFLYRKKNNRMIFDEYNFWILDPEQLIQRTLDSVFTTGSRNGVNIYCLIEKFEFDLTKNQAELKAVVSFDKSEEYKKELFSISEKFSGPSSCDAAKAMDKCVDTFVERLAASCAEFSKSKGDKK